MGSLVNPWPELYHKARTGALHSWYVYVDGDEIVSQWGQVDGVRQETRKKAIPKNVGRSNATTAHEQAVLEAAAMHKFKLDRKYSLTPEEAQEEVRLPMLAHPYEKYAKKVTWPADAQPKLNGVRALAEWVDGQIVLTTRAGKTWDAPDHINREIEKWLPPNWVLDGEIYVHGKPLQWITSRAKKKHLDTPSLEYHVYDVPQVDGYDACTWKDRRILLENRIPGFRGPVTSVATYTVHSYEELKAYHDTWVEQGFEGAIRRDRDGLYEWGHRSPSLLKVKAFQDDEFEIVGHKDGVGKEAGAVIWLCKTKQGNLFETRPRGTYDERRELFKTAPQHYGRMLTVRFFEYTPDGMPFHPVGIAIREPEDL